MPVGGIYFADVSIGTITEFSVLSGRTPQFSEEGLASGPTWRLYPTKPIGEYFTECQEKMQGKHYPQHDVQAEDLVKQ